MNRTAEKVLAIISAVLTVIGIILSFVSLAFFNYLKSDPMIRTEIEAELLMDATLTPADVDMFYSISNFIGGFIWLIIIGLLISLILIIIGLVNIWSNKNPKLAGTLFIIAGLTGGILNLTSILLYIAGILCITKKPPTPRETQFVDEQYDGTMRPL
ncbi:DUF4064 domain-containing protein [Sporosarcina sp. JAI121]|uniref:DUF4064 domain-containing protein n=1 Tax=Sporosarcina sp. JAI121 TaxID=2723064 RepID=UPI0015CE56AC|nr:DUF4064 domain-containing protein [Sporosarcina sp. JAI121]NYF25931.1 uncharacterized protein YxeA [Sporosarcina sp. JAI121]